MNKNSPAILRSLVIFGLCIPLAAWIGYLLAAPADRSTFGIGGILALVMLTPLLLRRHHFLMIAGWNLGLTIFFLPGSPPVWLLLTALSLGLSVLQRTLNNQTHFLHAPEIACPLIFMLLVVLVTAKLNGGIGLHSMGAAVSGGKRYFTIIFGIFGYFALTAMRIPQSKVKLYIFLFYLGGFSSLIGDLGPFLPSSLSFVFAFFPMTVYDLDSKLGSLGFNPRYAGVGSFGVCGLFLMLAYFGLRSILLGGKLWRLVLFVLFLLIIPLSGFRSMILLCGGVIVIQFYLEDMHREKIMFGLILIGIMGIALIIPFSNKLPYTFQRSLAFLPLKIDKAAQRDAEDSSGWRLQIWRDTLPQVPKYLLLGKGYSIDMAEMSILQNRNFRYLSTADEVALSGNYHSGPLSVLMPFGAWGGIGILWLFFAGIRALYGNYRYGDPAFRNINSFLFASFSAKIILFLIVFGAIESDMASFCVILGLSVSINGGIRRPPPVPVAKLVKSRVSLMAGPPLQPVFPR